MFAIGGNDNKIYIYDIRCKKFIRNITTQNNWTGFIKNQSSKYLIYGDWNKACVYDFFAGKTQC